MKRVVPSIVALFGGLIGSPAAHACRIIEQPAEAIKRAYSTVAGLQVAVVTIMGAEPITLSNNDGEDIRNLKDNWRAVASVDRIVVGSQSPKLVVFDGNWRLCSASYGKPEKGDRWVIYYSTRPLDRVEVLLSYPLKLVVPIDPRLRRNDH